MTSSRWLDFAERRLAPPRKPVLIESLDRELVALAETKRSAQNLMIEAPGRTAGGATSWTDACRICVASVHRDLCQVFTGLIEEVGSVLGMHVSEWGTQLQIGAPRVAEKIWIGDSIAVNGCCLTVAAHRDRQFTCDLLEETLDRTNLKTLTPGSRVNLERALAADGRLGGHFVQGHVDCAARIIALGGKDADHRLEVELPTEFSHYVAYKGSIAVNGISLTVAEVFPQSFAVWIIPHTRGQTNLDTARTGDLVNLEFDLIAKYLERMRDRDVVRS